MSLGARLTQLRLNAGESLQDVADAVGVSKAHIWEMEKGRTHNPSLTILTGLADHFKLSVGALIGEDPNAADADVSVARMFRRAKELHPDDLKVLDDVMDSLLRRRGEKGARPSRGDR
jgi:transcriptional regulator with XRE-family HTH domain